MIQTRPFRLEKKVWEMATVTERFNEQYYEVATQEQKEQPSNVSDTEQGKD